MANHKLEQRLVSFFDGAKADVLGMPVKREHTTLDEIRDAMLDIGVILEEDLEQGIYVARITGGRRKAYGPIIAATTCDEGVDVAGIVIRGKQRPVVEAISAFEAALDGNPPKIKKQRGRFGLFFYLALVVAGVVTLSLFYLFSNFVIPTQVATVKYNEAVGDFNVVVSQYNDVADGVDVENLRGFVQEARELTAQGTDFVSICKALACGNGAEKIDIDTVTVQNMTEELAGMIPVLEAIDNPSAVWVASKLVGVDGIDQIGSVTTDDDPNGMLGKKGGYSSCTYFTTGLLGKNVVKGSNPVQKGVDGGGAVEVYPALKDARARCEYLSEFDGTILYSGSYAIVGTMVIRTSCLLDDDAQYALTHNIVNSMIEE